jgi:hypothetical protein
MFQTSCFHHQEDYFYIHFKKFAFCWLTLHTVSQCTVQKTYQTNFTHEIKITHCLFQSTSQALISFNKGKINCRTVTQSLQGPCMNLLSYIISYIYLNFISISTPRHSTCVHLLAETNNTDNLILNIKGEIYMIRALFENIQ